LEFSMGKNEKKQSCAADVGEVSLPSSPFGVNDRCEPRVEGVRLQRRLLAKAETLLAQEYPWREVEFIAGDLLVRGVMVISGRAARHLLDRGLNEC
jgi:hypothetical protein